MFAEQKQFGDDIRRYDEMGLEGLGGVFHGTGTFHQPLNNWNVNNVKAMNGMQTLVDLCLFHQSFKTPDARTQGTSFFILPFGVRDIIKSYVCVAIDQDNIHEATKL